MNKILFIVYDGIGNSVFCSQVLTPIFKRLAKDEALVITLVSFERHPGAARNLCEKLSTHDRLHIIVQRKLPFFGKASLWYAVWKLQKLVRLQNPTHIMARGPLAGWVALKALACTAKRVPLTIQARGLCAEEFAYVAKRKTSFLKTSFLKTSFLKMRLFYRWYKTIEHEVYKKTGREIRIETVSPALKIYLEKTCDADPQQVSVSSYDIPERVPEEMVAKWRRQVRDELVIPHDAYVVCYTGSARAWQCVDEMIAYVAKYLDTSHQDERSFFLVFSADKTVFETKLKNVALKNKYLVMSIKPDDSYRYLSAADAGLLFREDDVVNWVSRPTKMLEYQAVGLRIIHNDTVAWLASGNP